MNYLNFIIDPINAIIINKILWLNGLKLVLPNHFACEIIDYSLLELIKHYFYLLLYIMTDQIYHTDQPISFFLVNTFYLHLMS